MRRLLLRTAAGLCLASLLGPGAALGRELKAEPSVAPTIKEVVDPTPTCGKHGTTIDFVATPAEAAKQAKKEGKLVFVLHVSGHFEAPNLTGTTPEGPRAGALANPAVGKYTKENGVRCSQRVGRSKTAGKARRGATWRPTSAPPTAGCC